MKDIENRSDIEHLVDTFYKKVVDDELIAHFFTDVAKINWDKHLPKMYDFWENTLFYTAKYKGNPMLVHIDLTRKSRLKAEHFERWLLLWEQNLLHNFEGPKATEALKKAKQIAGLMQYKVESIDS